MREQELIQEARNKGYRKGCIIHYHPEKQDMTDTLEGDYFEIDRNGDLNAYLKPKEERISFDDNRHDTIYKSSTNQWVKLIK